MALEPVSEPLTGLSTRGLIKLCTNHLWLRRATKNTVLKTA